MHILLVITFLQFNPVLHVASQSGMKHAGANKPSTKS